MKQTVSIVIPNWNGVELLTKNLPAVLAAAAGLQSPLTECIVVDDGSTDGSVAYLRKHFPSITVIALEHNYGFHTATNIGFERSHGSVVILLNSDIEPHCDAFKPLLDHFTDPDLFGVSGRIYSGDKKTFLYGNRGGFFRHGHFYLHEKEEYATTQSLFVCGGAGAFSREKFLSLGGFDTLYSPFYYEEQDISYRALKRGWHITYEPASIMYHQIRATIGKKTSSQHIRYLSARNNYLFTIKNITDPAYTVQMCLFIPLFLLRDLCRLRLRFWIAFALAVPRIPRALWARFKERSFRRLSDRTIFSRVMAP